MIMVAVYITINKKNCRASVSILIFFLYVLCLSNRKQAASQPFKVAASFYPSRVRNYSFSAAISTYLNSIKQGDFLFLFSCLCCRWCLDRVTQKRLFIEIECKGMKLLQGQYFCLSLERFQIDNKFDMSFAYVTVKSNL